MQSTLDLDLPPLPRPTRHDLDRERYERATTAAIERLREARRVALSAAFELACARAWLAWDRDRPSESTVHVHPGSFEGCGDRHAEEIARIADAIDDAIERLEPEAE